MAHRGPGARNPGKRRILVDEARFLGRWLPNAPQTPPKPETCPGAAGWPAGGGGPEGSPVASASALLDMARPLARAGLEERSGAWQRMLRSLGCRCHGPGMVVIGGIAARCCHSAVLRVHMLVDVTGEWLAVHMLKTMHFMARANP